jgi:hypothetical protein
MNPVMKAIGSIAFIARWQGKQGYHFRKQKEVFRRCFDYGRLIVIEPPEKQVNNRRGLKRKAFTGHQALLFIIEPNRLKMQWEQASR